MFDLDLVIQFVLGVIEGCVVGAAILFAINAFKRGDDA